jgi:prolyl oligopeptidase
MKNILILSLFVFSLSIFAQEKNIFPQTFKENIIDTIWEKRVEDPYRWMEDIHSDRTNEWLKSQEAITKKYSGKLAENIPEHLTNYLRIESKRITKQGKYYFSFYHYKLSKAASLYYQLTPQEEPHPLFDPSVLNRNSTDVISIDGIKLSGDGKTLALMISRNGSDWKTIHFLDMESRSLLNDSIRFVKYSDVYWSGNGVFYIQYDVKDESESFKGLIDIKALQYHLLGTDQKFDVSVYPAEQINDYFSFEVVSSGKYLIIYKAYTLNNEKEYRRNVSYRRLPLNNEDKFKNFIESDNRDVYFNVVDEVDDKLIVTSNLNARNGAIYKCNPEKINSFERLVPQYQERLQTAKLINNKKILALYNGDKRSFVIINDSTGKKLKSWAIPEGFSFNGLSYSIGDSVLIYYFNSFFSPASVYKVNLNTFESEPLGKTVVHFSIKDLTTEMVYFKSKDSTVIPMYLTHKKNIKLDGKNPVILYGYGGFGISMQPFFDVSNIPFLNSGGLLAVPQLRGGGEFPGWHEQGKRLNKQNTFDDFISAAEYLIKENYTTSELIAAMGGSNGGLLVGACMTQRPDLFKVIVSKAGVLDMLRYHLYNIGYVYRTEYGNIIDSLDFENLIKYSPVHNVKRDINYPATLIIASDNDDRVNPFHSFKFLAQLQTNGSGENPYVLYYQRNAGHTGSRVYEDRLKTDGYIYAFIYRYLGMEKKIYFED